MGVYQTDLTLIKEGNPNKKNNGFWNFRKCKLTANIIMDVQTFQTTPYNLQVRT
jgi:son of sevenless-like protein